MKKIFFGVIFFGVLSMFGYNFLDITKHGYEQYQDIIIHNKIVKPATHNHRDCETRYEIIQQILDKYKRPFTMLDIGASQGYYSFKTAHDYDSVCVMIEGNNRFYPMTGSQLLDLCKINNLDNIIHLNKSVVPNDLIRLSECEHFDVVLALNIIHWFPDQWQNVTDAILNMGDNIIIETPPQESVASNKGNQIRKKIENYLISKNAKILGKVSRHTSNAFSTIYLVESNKDFMERKTWIKKNKLNGKTHFIDSSFEKKQFTKQVDCSPDIIITSDWVPGINLITFKMYNGTYPLKEDIKNNIKKIKDPLRIHNDWLVNNMIIQGKKIVLIDYNDPTHNHPGAARYSEKLLNKHLRIVDFDNPTEFEHYFREVLIKQ